MRNTLEERDREILIRMIKKGKCTPFLEVGACFRVLPFRLKIANEWAHKYHYPLEESHSNLSIVSRFLVVDYDSIYPKDKIRNLLKDFSPHNYKELKSLKVCLQILFMIYMSKIIRLKGE